MYRVLLLLSFTALLDASSAIAQAPAPPDPANNALNRCIALAENKDTPKEAGVDAAKEAERLMRARLENDRGSAEARVALATAISRCRIPYANMMQSYSLVEESIGLLQEALAIDATNWSGRFMLAMNYLRMPEFLGKTDDAEREFQTLISQQHERADRPNFALPYLYLGDLYARGGRDADAVKTWRHGATLFPQEPRFHERLSKVQALAPGHADSSASVQAAFTATRSAHRSASPQVYALAPLSVEASNYQLNDARSATALRRLDVVTIPGGTGDMMQALQTLPGATRASDGSDLYVRGGDAAETAILLDGGRIPYAGRWETTNGAAMGVLDAMLLRKAYFSAGGFSARYGNALSAVVDVETEGKPASNSWSADANMVQLGASLKRRLSTRSGAWGVASVTDVTLLSHMNGEAKLYTKAPRSFQAVGGFAFEPTKRSEVRAVALSMRDVATRIVDAAGYSGDFENHGSTDHVAISGRWLSEDSRSGITANLTGGMRNSSFAFGVLDRDRRDGIAGVRVDADHTGPVRIRTGAEATFYHTNDEGHVPVMPQLAPGSATRAVMTNTWTQHVGAYAELEQSPISSVKVALGTRVDRLPGETNVTIDPRAALAWQVGAWALRAGAGEFHQGRYRTGYMLPDPGEPAGLPRRADHVVLGAERTGEPSLRVDLYRKHYDDYVADSNSGPAITNSNVRGVDAMIRWSKQSRLNGWVTYSYTRGRNQVEEGAIVPSKLDITHTATAIGRLALNDQWELGSTLRYATGKPYSAVSGVQSSTNGADEPIYSAIHGSRTPAYVRSDARLMRYTRAPGMFGVLYLEMINLLNRRNVQGYTYNADYSEKLPIRSFFAYRTFVLGVELQSTRK